jgi:hypothetical protein
VGLAIGCDFTPFDGLDQRRNDRMRVVEVSCRPEIAQTRCGAFGSLSMPLLQRGYVDEFQPLICLTVKPIRFGDHRRCRAKIATQTQAGLGIVQSTAKTADVLLNGCHAYPQLRA